MNRGNSKYEEGMDEGVPSPREEMFIQGTTYEESHATRGVGDIRERDSREDDDVEEVYSPRKKGTPDKKIFVMAGVLIFVIILAVVLGTYFLKDKSAKGEKGVSDEQDKEELSEEERFLRGMDEDIQLNYYDEGTKRTLKNLGKTDEEIAQMETDGILSDEAIKMSKKDLDAIVRDRYFELKEEVFNTQGDSFNKLLRYTWLAGRDIDLNALTSENIANIVTMKENCDYIKVPARGNQCFLRVENKDGDVFFMEVSPDSYILKGNVGNIVVQYNLAEYKNGQKIITNIVEINVVEE